MKAELIVSDKFVYEDGAIRQVIIWLLPRPVPPSQHRFKYRMVFIRDGQRILGFDNERGKGDHIHTLKGEWPYVFRALEQLLSDFDEAIEIFKDVRLPAATTPTTHQPETSGGQVIDLMAALRAQLESGRK